MLWLSYLSNIKELCNKDLYSLTIYICTRPKILETNDEICVVHLRAQLCCQPMDPDDDDAVVESAYY